MPGKVGRPPLGDKAIPKVASQFRVDATLFAKLKRVAQVENRSANAQIERFIREGVARFEAEHGTIVVSEEDE